MDLKKTCLSHFLSLRRCAGDPLAYRRIVWVSRPGRRLAATTRSAQSSRAVGLGNNEATYLSLAHSKGLFIFWAPILLMNCELLFYVIWRYFIPLHHPPLLASEYTSPSL